MSGYPRLRMFAPMVMVYLLRTYMDTESPESIWWIRILFASGKLAVLAVYAFIWMRVGGSSDTRIIKVSPADLQPPNPFAKSLMGEDHLVAEDMTVKDYDSKALGQRFSMFCTSGLMVIGLHYYKEMVIPLVLASVMGLWSLYSDQLVQIYILGRDPYSPPYASALKRPFKQAGPFGDMMKPWHDLQEQQKRQVEKKALRQQKKAANPGLSSKKRK